MPISFEIDPRLGLVRTTATGVLTDEELLQHKRDLQGDPRFDASMKELSDIRGVERLDVTAEGVRRAVAMDQGQADALGDYKLALVVSADVVFGMARMYQMMTEENIEGVGVFRDIEEALEWLGVKSASD